MAGNDEVHKVVVIDIKQGQTTAIGGLKNLDKETDNAKASTKELQEETKKATAVQEKFNQVLADTGRQSNIDDLARQYGELARDEEKATQAADDLLRKLQEIGATDSEIEGAARQFQQFKSGGSINKDTFGDASTGLSGLAGAAGAVGQGGAGSVLQLGSDISGAIEKLPKLGSSIKDFASNISPAGVVIAAAGAAVALALAATQDAVDKTNEVAKGFFTARQAQADFADFDTTQAEAKKAELQKIIDENTAIAVDAEKIKQQTFEELAAQIGDPAARAAFAVAEARGQFSELDKGLEAAKTSAADAQAQLDALSKLERDGTIAANTLATGIDDLGNNLRDATTGQVDYTAAIKGIISPLADQSKAVTDTISDTINYTRENLNLGDAIKSTLSPLVEATAAHNKIQAVLSSYDATKAETASKRTLAAAEAAQNAAIKEAQVKEDRLDAQKEALATHQDKIQQIEANGLKAVEGIRKELADGIAKQLAAISDAEKDLTKLEADYNKQELARQKKFNDDKSRLEKKFKEDSADLIASGSFDALADLQRQNKDDKKNLRKEFKGGKSEAKDEFDEQKALAEEKIAALKVELDAFKTNEADKLKAAQEQTTAAIDAENKAFDGQEKKREAAYQKQDEREQQAADLRAQRLAEAQQREDAALDARTAKQLEAIGTVEARQEAATLNASAAFDLLDISISKLVSTAAAVGGATAKGIGDAIAPSVTTPPIKAYAKGGLIDKPTLALMGEKGKELVLPYEPSKGLPAALNQGFGGNGKGGAGSVSVQVDGTMQVTIEGGADAGTVKKLERMLDERDVKLVKVMNRSLHTILDGKEPV